MADSIKKRTQKGSRTSALSSKNYSKLSGSSGVKNTSVIHGGQHAWDTKINTTTQEQKKRKKTMGETSKAMGPNSPIQSPKKPKPGRAADTRGIKNIGK